MTRFNVGDRVRVLGRCVDYIVFHITESGNTVSAISADRVHIARSPENLELVESAHYAKPGVVNKLLDSGVLTDGAHHKQWHFEQIAAALSIELLKHEAGIAP